MQSIYHLSILVSSHSYLLWLPLSPLVTAIYINVGVIVHLPSVPTEVLLWQPRAVPARDGAGARCGEWLAQVHTGDKVVWIPCNFWKHNLGTLSSGRSSSLRDAPRCVCVISYGVPGTAWAFKHDGWAIAAATAFFWISEMCIEMFVWFSGIYHYITLVNSKCKKVYKWIKGNEITAAIPQWWSFKGW